MAEKLLRFKDVLKMDGKDPMSRPLDFDDMHVTNYLPGEDPLVNYRAYRRKRTIGVGEGGPIGEARNPLENQPLSTGKHKKGVTPGYTFKHKTIKDPANPKRHTHVHQLAGEEKEVDEALTVTQRLARKRMFKRLQPRIKLGRERAKRRIASKEKLEKRARKAARAAILKKITKDIPKSELTYARRQELEKRLDTPAMKKRIGTIARRLFPKIRQAELAKKRGGQK
jgi:hypothetical protein